MQPLPDPVTHGWPAVVAAVKARLPALPPVFCPARRAPRPWLDPSALATHGPDPSHVLLAANEALLWSLFTHYAGAPPTTHTEARNTRRLLPAAALWRLLEDFGLVPTLVNRARFARLMRELGDRYVTSTSLSQLHPRLSIRG